MRHSEYGWRQPRVQPANAGFTAVRTMRINATRHLAKFNGNPAPTVGIIHDVVNRDRSDLPKEYLEFIEKIDGEKAL